MVTAQTKYEKLNIAINKGEFTKASKMIDDIIKKENLNEIELYDLNFQKERMDRIRKDFRKTEDDIISYIKKYYPDVTSADLKNWEEDGTLEYKIIDGEKLYFNRSQGNLFRVNKEAKKKKIDVDGDQKGSLDLFLEEYLPDVVKEAKESEKNIIKPQKMRITYTLKVDADAVPAGEMIRCWLPYPRNEYERQTDIKLLDVNCKNYIIAPDNYLHKSIYIEKEAKNGEATIFEYSLSYTGKNEFVDLDINKIKEYDTNSDLYKKYTLERAPHIVFTDKVKSLSHEIVGNETNKYLIAKKIFKWINKNIPWAGAREYSTIQNISDYCLTNGWGDCGIVTLTFITIARYNGIPARWQSGWMLHPGSKNLHDWGEIYFEGYGWVPMDQSFGLVASEDEDVHWFFFGGMDAYHFIVNDDFSKPFYPAKIFPRSETVDFQRGEVEWRGGNLYFDKWDYHMEVEYLD